MQLTITLHIDNINAALNALAKLPYEQAQPHIDAIRDRASVALQEAQQKAQAANDGPVVSGPPAA